MLMFLILQFKEHWFSHINFWPFLLMIPLSYTILSGHGTFLLSGCRSYSMDYNVRGMSII